MTTIADLDIPAGETWFPEDQALASPYIGGSVFTDFGIHHSEDGFYAHAGMWVDFVDGYNAVFGLDPDADDYDEDVANEWLNDHYAQIEAFFTERYGCEWDGSADQWSAQRLYFSTVVQPSETPDEVFARLHSDKAVALYDESDAGTFGCEYVFRLLREHIEKQ